MVAEAELPVATEAALKDLTTHGSHEDPRLNTEWGDPDSPFHYELRRTEKGPRPVSR